jgi:hypothetical protein
MEIGMRIMGQDFLYTRAVTEVKIAESVNERMLYIILRGHRCVIIVHNKHGPNGRKVTVQRITSTRN